jgi:hypothetical protein
MGGRFSPEGLVAPSIRAAVRAKPGGGGSLSWAQGGGEAGESGVDSRGPEMFLIARAVCPSGRSYLASGTSEG